MNGMWYFPVTQKREDRGGPYVAYPQYVDCDFNGESVIGHIHMSTMRVWDDDAYLSFEFTEQVMLDSKGNRVRNTISRQGARTWRTTNTMQANGLLHVSAEFCSHEAAAMAIVVFSYWGEVW